MADDYDSPWKDALDLYFDAFLALLFPDVHAQIDWPRGYESMDKEFQQIANESEVGRKHVDKLVKVWTKPGIECWVLIHVEVQAARDADFPLRMFVYNYRIFDRYNKRAASLAVLADDDRNWRPSEFRASLFGCEASLRFPAVKLTDFEPNEAELEASANPFAKVVLAHLKTQQTHGDPVSRSVWKLRLVRSLFEQGMSAKDVREIFRIIDWFMKLPPMLSKVFWKNVTELQTERKMPFITTPERIGLQKGMREGIRLGLKLRYGDDGLKLMPEIEEIDEEEMLRAILKALETDVSIREIRKLWASGEA